MSTPTLSPTSTVVSSSSPQSISPPRQSARTCCPTSQQLATSVRPSTSTTPVQALVSSPGVITVNDLTSALASTSISSNVSPVRKEQKLITAGAGPSRLRSPKPAREKIPKLHRPPSMTAPPSPPDSETERRDRPTVTALPPLIKSRRRLNRATHRRLSLNQQRQRSLMPPPPPPPTAVAVNVTPPHTPKQKPAEVAADPSSDEEVVEVRTTKKVTGKTAKARRVALPRIPTLAYAMPGRNGKSWQETMCCIEPLGTCVLEQVPGSSFCVEHTCRGVLEDMTGCTNPVYNPRQSRYCALGYHHETGRTDPLYEAVVKGKEQSMIRTAQRNAELESALDWFEKRFGKVVNFQGDGPDPACTSTSTPIAQHHSRLDLAWGPYSTGQDRYWQGEWRGPWSLSPIHFRPTTSRSSGAPTRMNGGSSA